MGNANPDYGDTSTTLRDIPNLTDSHQLHSPSTGLSIAGYCMIMAARWRSCTRCRLVPGTLSASVDHHRTLYRRERVVLETV